MADIKTLYVQFRTIKTNIAKVSLMSVAFVSKSVNSYAKHPDWVLCRAWHLIIIQCFSPLYNTVEQLKKIISCCLLCPCIMDKVRKLNTAKSTGCLCPMETCSFAVSSSHCWYTAVKSWMQYTTSYIFWGQCEALCRERMCACTYILISLYDNPSRMLSR